MLKLWLWLGIIILIVANLFVWEAVIDLVKGRNTDNHALVRIPDSIVQKNAPLPGFPKDITETVPILMYHYIRDYADQTDPLGIGLSVSPAVFEKQMIALKTAGYQTISLQGFYQHKLKPKSVILTFDDGYDDHYISALPILQRLQMTGTFFIVRGFIGRAGYMTGDQITALKTAGMEIGDHTVDHHDLAIQPYAAAFQEVLGGLPGTNAPVFAYPSGEYNPTTISILKSLGLRAAVTTKLGVATNLSPLLELPRIRIKQNTDVIDVINQQLTLLRKAGAPITASQINPNPVK